MAPFIQTFRGRAGKRFSGFQVGIVLESYHGTPAIAIGDWTQIGLALDRYWPFPTIEAAKASLESWDGAGDPPGSSVKGGA
jgi:hypothetical protein